LQGPVWELLGLISLELFIKEIFLTFILFKHCLLLFVPGKSSLLKGIMIEIQLFQFFWGRRQDVLAMQPAYEVRVLMEPILLQELV
jgi:hypothetical protein